MFVYTVWLKRRTPQNIVIGGAAGAVPPLVGWAAVTGSVSGTAVILFFIVFFWTPPHFWALSLLMKDEYEKVGVPMLPVVRGEAETRRQILLYSVLLYAVTQLPFCAGGFGAIYLVASLVLGLGFIAGAVRLYRRADRRSRAAAVPVLARLPGAAVLRDGRRRPPVGRAGATLRRGRRPEVFFAPMMTRRLARKNIRTGLIVCAICMFMFGITFVVAARLRLVSPLEPEVPPVGEEIHLPGPTILPLLTAIGITLALVGVTTFIELTVIGGILTLGCVVALDQRHAPRNRRAPARLELAAGAEQAGSRFAVSAGRCAASCGIITG